MTAETVDSTSVTAVNSFVGNHPWDQQKEVIGFKSIAEKSPHNKPNHRDTFQSINQST